MPDSVSRSSRLDRAIADLLGQAPEISAAAIVSFDGLPMASALPATMDEDRVAAMSAALLSLGERAAEGLGRGGLNQVYIEGEHGTVFLVSADDEAVLVAVADKGAKAGMMLYEVRRAADVVAAVLRTDLEEPAPASADTSQVDSYVTPATVERYVVQAPVEPRREPAPAETLAESPRVEDDADTSPVEAHEPDPVEAQAAPVEPATEYAPVASPTSWPSYFSSESTPNSPEPTPWS